MKTKKGLLPIIFLIMCLLFALLVSCGVRWKASEYALYQLAHQITEWDQLKQILISTVIYLYGYLFCWEITKGQTKYVCLLAYPAGIMCWCATSLFLVVAGIPYTLPVTLILLLLILLVVFLRGKTKIKWELLKNSSCIAVGIISVASTGVLMLMLTSDSQYYIMKYGEILAIDGAITCNTSYWLTWTGISSAFLGSLVKFFNLYSLGVVHHSLMISFFALIAVVVYQMLDFQENKKKRLGITALILVLAGITPVFFLLNHWQMQNSYYMGYMMLYLVLCCRLRQVEKEERQGLLWLICLSVLMLGMMRIESSVVMCFLIICASTLEISKKEILLYMLCPLGAAQLLYWIRVYVVLGKIESAIFNTTMLLLIAAAWMITFIYVLLLRKIFKEKLGSKLPAFILILVCLLNVLMAVFKWEDFKINVEVVMTNFANASWGYFPWLVLFGVMIVTLKGLKWNFFDFIWIGYLLFNFAVGMARNGAFRLGEGDSLNRIYCSIVPIILLSGVLHYRNYRIKEK